MNVSATRLVYVNKKSAKVRNEDTGDFVNEVPNGIPIEAGDLISVEGIAVESRGVGTSIIEIPSRVLDYPYLTNKMIMRFWYYINHNYQYECILPVVQNAFKTTGGTGKGYALGTGITIANHIQYEPKNIFQESIFGGQRFYIGAFAENVEDVTNPNSFTSQADADAGINPATTHFQFIECNKEISVDLGYDSPDNIAEQITADFHEGRFSPNAVFFRDGGARAIGTYKQDYIGNEWLNKGGNNATPDVMSATGSQDECVVLVRCVPYVYEAQNPTTPKYYSLYQGLMGVANPLYYYYGSRLLADAEKGSLTPFVGIGYDGDIYSYNLITNNGTDTTPQLGELLITTLKFTEQNLLWLRGLIHSQKNLQQTESYTTAQLRTTEVKKKYFWNIPVGRYDDSASTPYASNSTLGQYINPTQSTKPDYLKTRVFYDKDFYEKSGYFDTTGLGGTYRLNPEFEIGGLKAKGWSEKLDINVFCVDIPTNFGPPVIYDQVIAIPLLDQLVTNNLVLAGAFIVCDLTFSRPEACCVFLTNNEREVDANGTGSYTYNTMMKAMSIGAPDMAMEFDDQRGRFAIKNMYWANRIGNEGDAGKSSSNPINPDAEQECIMSNAVEKDLYIPKSGGTNVEVAYTKYSLSGLGLYDLSVLDEDGNETRVDRFDPDIIKEAYDNSLLSRLGFDYYGLINDYGQPMVIYQEQYFNTLNKVPYTTFFPYPLTNNPLIDTTFNQYINQNDYGAPVFTLNTQRNATFINIACQSGYVYATNLPQKLASPYWIICSDIIDGVKFVKDGLPVNSVAICNRSYISGDFAFSFATDYKFKADIPFTISSIKTKILTQDLLPADIDEGTSIIYKIEKQYQEEVAEAEEEKPTKKSK